MEDILSRLANSSSNESSHELQCRCFDAAVEIRRLRSALGAMLTEMGMDENEYNKPTFDQARKALTHNVK